MSDYKYAYTAKEYCDMVLICGECGGDAALAIQTYKDRYGEKRHCPTDPTVIIKAIQRIRQNKPLVPILDDNDTERKETQQRRPKYKRLHIQKKKVQPIEEKANHKKSKRKMKEREQNAQPVIQDENDEMQRKIVTRLRKSKESATDNAQNARTSLFQNGSATDQEIVTSLDPNREQNGAETSQLKKPPLLPRNKPIRFTYCQWLLSKSTKDFDFLSNIMWTGQTKFTYNNISIYVWAAIHRDRIIGPVFIDDDTPLIKILNGPVRDYVDELPVLEAKKLWYQVDLKEILDMRFEFDKMFGKQLICRFGPIRWPPQSKDLSPVHFFLWKFIKSKIFVKVNSVDDLKKNMVDAFDKAKAARDELEKVRYSTLQRSKLCCLSNGNYIDN